jgi:SsrA-binding protein
MEVIFTNKKARYEYEFIETEIAGIMLHGSEVKALREGKTNIDDAYLTIKDSKVIIQKMFIGDQKVSNHTSHDNSRDRIILMTKNQRRKWLQKLETKGLTIIPYKVFFDDKNICKIEVVLAKGKKLHDKRESIKSKDIDRDTKRELSNLN